MSLNKSWKKCAEMTINNGRIRYSFTEKGECTKEDRDKIFTDLIDGAALKTATTQYDMTDPDAMEEAIS